MPNVARDSVDNPESGETSRRHKLWTRGETCLCWHVCFTALALALLGVATLLHVFSQTHRDNVAQSRSPALRSPDAAPPPPPPPPPPVGVVRAGGRRVCAAAAMTPWWSLAPGHCAQAHGEPELADIAHQWRVTYVVHGKPMQTAVVRSVVHPRFNRDTFSYDVGLLQHQESLLVEEYRPWLTRRSGSFEPSEATLLEPAELRRASRAPHQLQPLPRAVCDELLVNAPLADHEWCIATRLQAHDCIELGSLAVAAGAPCGAATRGEACGGERGRPTLLVITDVAAHADWLQSTMDPGVL